MSGDVDGTHLLEAEVPLRVGIEERPHETAAGAVHMQRDINAALRLDLEQQVVDTDDVVLVSGKRRAEHSGYPDGVLVDVRADIVGADGVLAGLQRHYPGLDIEVAAKLLPHDMHVPAEHQVRVRC